MTSPETVDVPALRVVGIGIRTTNQAEARAESGRGPIAQLWDRVAALNLASKIPNPHVSGEMVAIYHDYASDDTGQFTITLGLRVTSLHQVPDGLDGVEVPFQHYARFPVTGDPSVMIGQTWQAIWDTELDRAFTFDLEIYQPGDGANPGAAEILVALRNESPA